MTARWWWAVSRVLLVRPWLWPTACAQAARLARANWWRQPPFLPLPSADYLRFRLQTAYGDDAREPLPEDLLTYLHWCRAWGRVAS